MPVWKISPNYKRTWRVSPRLTIDRSSRQPTPNVKADVNLGQPQFVWRHGPDDKAPSLGWIVSETSLNFSPCVISTEIKKAEWIQMAQVSPWQRELVWTYPTGYMLGTNPIMPNGLGNQICAIFSPGVRTEAWGDYNQRPLFCRKFLRLGLSGEGEEIFHIAIGHRSNCL